jgi:predicted nucleotidyltransferase
MYLDNYRNSLPPICRKYHVEKLYAFGSVLTDRFGPDSDVDLIVDFTGVPIEEMFDTFFDFKYALEGLFNRPVDLMAEQPIRNPVLRRSVETTKQLIYGRAN